MKNQFVIFYSWMSDQPDEENRKYIRKTLDKDAKKIEKEFGIKIIIDSDSRGEDGSDSIDSVIIKKIIQCDIFVCDITPMNLLKYTPEQAKPIPNPNVMYELGFAVSALGWNRCIMIWNSKHGNLNHAPFDIRNHCTITYCSGEKELSLYGILKAKIEDYEQLVKLWRTSKERSFDAEKYDVITQICSERDLVDSINNFLTNRTYNDLEFDWWNNLIYYYNHYSDNRFVDESIHQAYTSFLSELNKMVVIACEYNVQISYCLREDLEVSSDEWKRECRYKIKDPYDTLPEDKAHKLEKEIENAFNSIMPSLMKSYKAFRDLIRNKLLI